MMFAKVKAGHDKNHIYAVLKSDEKYVWLANGTTRPLEKPRKKNSIHVQLIKKLPDSVDAVLKKTDVFTDQIIEEALAEYNLYLNRI